MSIDDDYFDVSAFVEGTDVEKTFDRFAEHTKNAELENELLREKCRQLSITIKNMMKIQQSSDDLVEATPKVVRIPKFADTMNEFARVDKIDDEARMVQVSNMNMPYQGTLGLDWFKFDEVEFVKGV